MVSFASTMPKVEVYPPVKSILIELHYADKCTNGTNTFYSVQDFAQFLKDNPELGKALGYVPKKVVDK
jgi:hypothetical protein